MVALHIISITNVCRCGLTISVNEEYQLKILNYPTDMLDTFRPFFTAKRVVILRFWTVVYFDPGHQKYSKIFLIARLLQCQNQHSMTIL